MEKNEQGKEGLKKKLLGWVSEVLTTLDDQRLETSICEDMSSLTTEQLRTTCAFALDCFFPKEGDWEIFPKFFWGMLQGLDDALFLVSSVLVETPEVALGYLRKFFFSLLEGAKRIAGKCAEKFRETLSKLTGAQLIGTALFARALLSFPILNEPEDLSKLLESGERILVLA